APDEEVAAEVEDAAERAHRRTAYATAAALYRQAADLTPAPEERAARLGAAASLTLQAGLLDDAGDLAVQAEKLTAEPAKLARLARVHAAVEYERGDPRAASRMMVDAAAEAAPDERAAMLRTGAVYGWTSGELPAVLRAAELLPGDPTVRGLALLADGVHADGLPLLGRLVDEARGSAGPGPAADVPRTGDPGAGDRVRAAHLALIIGADEAALELASAEVAHARRHGLVGTLPDVLETLARAQIATGRHADAEATVAEAVKLARDTGRPHREGRLSAVLSLVAAIQGDEERLRELIAEAPPYSGLIDAAPALLDLGL